MARKIVHVVGTGTIGEPLIGLLCDFKEDLGIDEVTFHKNSPIKSDLAKVNNLLKRGARLTTHQEKFETMPCFQEYGSYTNSNTVPKFCRDLSEVEKPEITE